MELFFFGLSGSVHADRQLPLDGRNVLISSAYFYSWRTRNFTKQYYIPEKANKIFIDSGAYSFIRQNGEYPFGVRRYATFIKRIERKIDFFSTMDYPITKQMDKHAVKKLIMKTIDNTELLANNYKFKATLIPILQGMSFEDYIFAFNEYKKRDLIGEFIGIGGLLFKPNPKRMLLKIVNKINPTQDYKIHVYGFGISYLKDDKVFNAIYSSDTTAWCMNHDGKGLRYSNTVEDMLRNFKSYAKKVDELFNRKNGQNGILAYIKA